MSRFRLYHRHLDAFLACARHGSFTKAAPTLFVSPTALIKQIDQLEYGIGQKLFDRTPRGIALTAAGERLLDRADELVRVADRVLDDVRHASLRKNEITVATSLVFSGRVVMDLWYRYSAEEGGTTLRVIPYENTRPAAEELLRRLGDAVDVMAGVSDDRFLATYGCAGRLLSRLPVRCCVEAGHPLADRKVIRWEDLRGYTLTLPEYGMLEDFDAVHRALRAYLPDAKFADFNFLDLDVFNRVAREGAVLFNIDPWTEVHPLFRSLPIDWDLTVRFGILHALNPSDPVKRFLVMLPV